MIAWRYLRARRAEGGGSLMNLIRLIGITLAVFALVAADGGQVGRPGGLPVARGGHRRAAGPVSYTHLRAHATLLDLACRLLL